VLVYSYYGLGYSYYGLFTAQAPMAGEHGQGPVSTRSGASPMSPGATP